jgi:hypothetical protein
MPKYLCLISDLDDHAEDNVCRAQTQGTKLTLWTVVTQRNVGGIAEKIGQHVLESSLYIEIFFVRLILSRIDAAFLIELW